MKKLALIVALPILSFSLPALAGDGAENATISIDNEAKGFNVAVSGEVKTPVGLSVKALGKANAGSVDVKGSIKDSTVIIKNKANGVNLAIGNANAGSVQLDMTN